MSAPHKAFILAAGMGTRLRPYTDSMPKPMVNVGSQSIIHRTLQKLEQIGVTQAVINTHYLAQTLEDHLKDIVTPEIIISREAELLNTGGGIKNALHHFNDAPFYIINGDALWEDGDIPALERMANAWAPDRMDILMLLQPIDNMVLTHGVGDYTIDEDGKATRSLEKQDDYMFAGIHVANPAIFKDVKEDAFSFLNLMDATQKAGRLYGLPHDGAWHHISTPEELESVDAYFKKSKGSA